MRKNILTLSLLAASFTSSAQVLFHVSPNTRFFVGENALVYNGGGLQTQGDAIYEVRGNVMVVGNGTTDVFRTLNADGTNRTTGGNFILRMNRPGDYANATNPSTYGQLYLQGFSQANIVGVVDKEYRAARHGTYQQIALPFSNKTISSLSGAPNAIGTFGKTFTNTRYSQNEVLVFNNTAVVSDNLAVSSVTPRNTAYYMLGSKGLDTANPPASMPANAPVANGTVYTLRGVPFAEGISEVLVNAGSGIDFGAGGNNRNSYNERYNTYLQDQWDYPTNPTSPWSIATFGKNIYQFGNPYLTNLDLGMIGINETNGDGNSLSDIQGIRVDPGTVVTSLVSGTFSRNAQVINFTNGAAPVGDVGVIIRPMQTFVVKMRNNNPQSGQNRTLNFDTLRRFNYTPRAAGTSYSVTAARNVSNSVKQLGVIALDEKGQEMARTYYVVYPDAVSGNSATPTVQSTLGSTDIIGTYEEHPVNGGVDPNFENMYWLYINEANEVDFKGKAIPLALYNDGIKALKFEIRENAQLVNDRTTQLSSGTGFYYQTPDGEVKQIAQNQEIPVTSDQYNLYYGQPDKALSTDVAVKPSRTMVVYNPPADQFVVRFDPQWKRAQVQVFDISGKLIIFENNIPADRDFALNLTKGNSAYIVTAISETGAKISTKIIR